MKKASLLILMVAGLLSFTTISNAQSGRFSLGLDLGFPMGDFGKLYDLGVGPTFRYEHPVGDNIGLSITTGILIFAGGSSDEDGFVTDVSAVSMIPVQLGFKYYFTEQQLGFYGMAEVGIHSSTYASTDLYESRSSTDLSYAPQIGYCLNRWDFGLRYQMISSSQDVPDGSGGVTSETSTSSFLGLRVAFVFGNAN